jgi:hypothetical protein
LVSEKFIEFTTLGLLTSSWCWWDNLLLGGNRKTKVEGSEMCDLMCWIEYTPSVGGINAEVDPRVVRGLKGQFCNSCSYRLRATVEANTPSGAVRNR